MNGLEKHTILAYELGYIAREATSIILRRISPAEWCIALNDALLSKHGWDGKYFFIHTPPKHSQDAMWRRGHYFDSAYEAFDFWRKVVDKIELEPGLKIEHLPYGE